MSSISGDDSSQWDAQSIAHEEKIYVSIRLRPLNEREISRNEASDWECINSSTVIFKNSPPTAYTFDRVFGPECHTRHVYDESAKSVALSVLSGMNASIFAYGQTSSGKTYTMRGITEYTIADIYDYIERNDDREFTVKFSALEIYNESVRDLLSSDSTPLRLLDDPERGTVVDKLTEVTLTDWSHLKELLAVCEAQRQIGETSLNEASSRSHQILRLTVESSAHRYLKSENSSTVTATVNFVDLAGSERASQILSAGTRLKEGSHINRSLLTLGKVIRQLSKGRNGHIPYRDSKLTRILQNSLGGNARTAIICTMSPAHSHVEQSRNTLMFASCAKQVSTNAQVNVVMSEKALVKQLQKELARLENEMRNIGLASNLTHSATALQEKELVIQKMDREIKVLTQQRDQALSRLEDLLRSKPAGEFSNLSHSLEKGAWLDDYPASEVSEIIDPLRSDVASIISHYSDRYEALTSSIQGEDFFNNCDEQFLSDDTSPGKFIDKYFGPDPCRGWEKIAPQSEDNCEEVTSSNTNSVKGSESGKIELDPPDTEFNATDYPNKSSEEIVISSQEHEDCTVEPSPGSSDSDDGLKSIDMSMTSSCVAALSTTPLSPRSRTDNDNDTTPSNLEKQLSGNREMCEDKPPLAASPTAEDDSTHEDEQNPKISGEDAVSGDDNNMVMLNETIKVDSPKKQVDGLVEGAGTISTTEEKLADDHLNAKQQSQSPWNWSAEFDRQRQEIIELWDACNIPLIYRTYFFLLFKGEASDSVYMEVELRRLSFLKNALSGGSKIMKDGQSFSESSSLKALNHERMMLSKQMLKKLSAKEREALYKEWGIELNKKRRRLQLCHKLWTDTHDMKHIKESAALVERLVGLLEPSQAVKEMIGLSFTPKPLNRRSSWKHTIPYMM